MATRTLTLEQKAALTSGQRLLAHGARAGRGHPADHGHRRAARPAQAAGGRRSVRHRRQHPGDVLPARGRARVHVGRRARARRGRGARRGGEGGEGRRPARPRREHQALAALRPQLRVLLRGPVPRRRARRGVGATASSRRASAPRSSTSPRTTRRPTGCGSARASTTGRCARSTCPAFERVVKDAQPLDGDVLVQQDQRHVRVGEPLAADRAAARRMGLRRSRRLGLGRGERPRRVGARRAST